MNDIWLKASDAPLTIYLPGAVAVRIDASRRVIGVDDVSTWSLEPRWQDWHVHDLRDSTYGDFHHLEPYDKCTLDCSDSEHLNPIASRCACVLAVICASPARGGVIAGNDART